MSSTRTSHDITDLAPGDHLCWVYDTEEDHRAVITPFLRQGLERGGKVLYIVDAHPAETVLAYLREDGLEVEPYLARGQLRILTATDTYLAQGVFDPDAMVALLRSETARALAGGYQALRVTGEMTWALRGLHGSDRLIEYEAKLNTFFPGSRCLAICQYDRRRFQPELLLDVLRTHPKAAIGTEVYDNFYYAPVSEVLEGRDAGLELCRWIRNLTQRKQAEEALRKEKMSSDSILENMPAGIAFLDNDLVLRKCNSAYADLIRTYTPYSPEQALGMSYFDYAPGSREQVGEWFVNVRDSGQAETRHGFRLALKRDGREEVTYWDTSIAPVFSAAGNVEGILILTQDVTERKRAEEALRVSQRFLEIANRHTHLIPLLEEFVSEVQNFTGCAAVGIRILDKQGNIPYQAYRGFEQRFYELESPLAIKSDQCMCINVITRAVGPKLPYYTEGGSFYINRSTRFLATVPEEEKGRTRNACNQFGYESVALIPIRMGDDMLGLIHVADPQEDKFPLEMVETLEEAARQLGPAIQRVRAEEEIRNLAKFPSENPNPVLRADRDGTVLYANAACAPLLHLWRSGLGSALPGDCRALIMETLRTGTAREIEVPSDGQLFSIILVPIVQNNYVNFYGRNITERKRAGEALRRERDRAQQYLDTARVMLVALDVSGRVALINRKGCEILGYHEAELLGRDWFETCLPEDVRDEVRGVFGRIMAGDLVPAEYYENPVLTKSGARRLLAFYNTVVRDTSLQIIGTLSFGEDITERKRAEEALRESERHYRRIVETANEGIWVIDGDSRTTFTNSQMASMLDYTVEEMIGRPLFSLMDEEWLAMTKAYVERRRQGIHESHEFKFRRKDGTDLWAIVSATPIFDTQGKYEGAFAMITDITERNRAEEALRFTRFSVDNAADTMVWVDHDARFIDVNDAFCRSSGYSREELLSMTVHDIDPDYSAEIWPEFWEKLKQSGSLTFEPQKCAIGSTLKPAPSERRWCQ